MRKILSKPVLVFCLLFSTACADPGTSNATPTLSELHGQWVVINYWAQWCKPCIEEIPELNTLDQKYDDVTVLGVNYDGATGPDLQQQVQTLGVAFPTLEADPSGQLGVSRPVVLPTTFIINADGQLVTTLLGPQTLESLERAVSKVPD